MRPVLALAGLVGCGPAVAPATAVEICGTGVDEDGDPATDCDDVCLEAFDYRSCDAPAHALPAPFAHWSFAEGHGAPGTRVGAPSRGTGFVGTSAWLDGSTSWTLDAEDLPPGRFSFTAWVRVGVDDNPGAYHFIASDGVGGTYWTGAALYLANGLDVHALTEAGTRAQESFADGDAVCADKWSFVAMTFEAGSLSAWADGGEAATEVGYPEVVWGENALTVGTDPNTPGRGFVGELDEVRIFASALTEADLAALRRRDLCARATR